jgi:hypothetical protein
VSLGTKLGLSVFLASDPGAARFAVPPAPEMLEQNQNFNSQQTEWSNANSRRFTIFTFNDYQLKMYSKLFKVCF